MNVRQRCVRGLVIWDQPHERLRNGARDEAVGRINKRWKRRSRVMSEDEARSQAEALADGMGITFYVVRGWDGGFHPAQRPSDDFETVERVEPPGHKSAFDRE
jgi:hypothetical protein